MSEIAKKALALVNKVAAERGEIPYYEICRNELAIDEALCRAIEQHEADKAAHAATIEGILKAHEAYQQEVSDAVEAVFSGYHDAPIPWVVMRRKLEPFIIPKPDPLADAWIEATGNTVGMGPLNEALAKRGLKIVETGQ